MLKKLPNARFVIAGDGPERSRLETIVSENGMNQQVHFLGSVQDIPGVLSMIDLFALTSHNEASPVSIMEALSCQRPVVATDVGSIDETVIDSENGFLVPVDNAEAMSSQWLKILHDRELSKRFGKAGRNHIIETCSLDVMTEGYMNLIEMIFDQKMGSCGCSNPSRGEQNDLPTGIVSWQVDMVDGNSVQ